MPPDFEIVREWLIRADRDLQAARLLLENPTPLLEYVLFHCQQAVEKALKGYIEYREIRPPKTHVIAQLLDLAEVQDSDFASIRDSAWLTPYAVSTRYPGFEPEPTAELAREGITTAKQILAFVTERLSAEAKP